MNEEIIRIALPLYFVFYFGYVFIYKSRLVAKEIGKSPMVLPKNDTAYGLIGNSLGERVIERRMWPWNGHQVRNANEKHIGENSYYRHCVSI